MGIKNRSIASTNMNEHSSRSHLIYTIHLSGINLIENITFNSKLHLIDLAGSERLSKSIVSGETQREAIFINKSLSALGDVIAAKISKNSHIPFRNSTLTYFLQNSLSGDSKTLMILQVILNLFYFYINCISFLFIGFILKLIFNDLVKIFCNFFLNTFIIFNFLLEDKIIF